MNRPAYPEATFLSKVTGSATHELRNVLAIIKESNGLMGDMAQICARGGTLNEDRIAKVVARVDAQVKRGADILSGLNRLSHCLDVERGVLDLREEVEQVVFMSGRKARNRRQTLEVTASSGQAQVTASPLHLHMALFSVSELCIEGFPEGSSVSVGVEPSSTGPTVIFRGDAVFAPGHSRSDDGEPWRKADELVSALGARIEETAGRDGIRVSFGVA